MSLLYRVSHLHRAQATQSSQLDGRCPPPLAPSRLLHTPSRTSRASTSPWPRVRSTNCASLGENGPFQELLDVAVPYILSKLVCICGIIFCKLVCINSFIFRYRFLI